MTAAHILAELEQIDRDRAALMEQLRAALAGDAAAMLDAPPIAAKQVNARPKWMLAARAFADRYPLNAWQVRRICANYDWALKLARFVRDRVE